VQRQRINGVQGRRQDIVLVAGVVITGHVHARSAISRFFTTLSASGLTGLLTALAVEPLPGGYAAMRRLTF
jgi:hypothetical protein